MPWSSPGVYDAETGTIPAYVTGLTPLPLPEVLEIISVTSDESTLSLEGNVLVPRIVVEVKPQSEPDATTYIECQVRRNGIDDTYYDAEVISQTPEGITIGDVAEGDVYDLRMRWRVPGSILAAAWTEHLDHTVVGQTGAPPILSGLALSSWTENTVLLRWDPIDIVDVRRGGSVRFRHTDRITGVPTWGNSTSIGEPVLEGNHIILPAKTGFYLARVFDSLGNGSGVSFISASAPTLLSYTNLATLTENPSFSGQRTNLMVSGSELLFASGQIDGTYEFNGAVDLGESKEVRATSVLRVTGTDDTDAWVEYRVTTDDPGGSPTWKDWQRLDTDQVLAWGMEFRMRAVRTINTAVLRVTMLGVVVDGPNVNALNWRGVWNSGSMYSVLDGVSYLNSSYVCIQAHDASASNAPGTPGGAAYWNVLVDSFSLRGPWAVANQYITLDITTNDARTWICNADHTSTSANEPTSMNDGGTFWDLLSSVGVAGVDGHGLDWRGAWATGESYTFSTALSDLVSFNGRSWICIQTHASDATNMPGTAGGASYWDLFVERGAAGLPGTPGTNGPGIEYVYLLSADDTPPTQIVTTTAETCAEQVYSYWLGWPTTIGNGKRCHSSLLPSVLALLALGESLAHQPCGQGSAGMGWMV